MFVRVVAFAFLGLIALPETSHACALDTKTALRDARAALERHDPKATESAVACLANAIEALDRKLDDLMAGKIAFERVMSRDGMVPAADSKPEAPK